MRTTWYGRLAAGLMTAGVVLGLSRQASAGAKPKPAKSPTARTAPAKPAPKGFNTGITVHGHWVIEVKNPDGKVVKRVEFENSLATPSGPAILAEVLTGNLSPGSWSVFLTLGTNNAGTSGFMLIAQAGSAASASCTSSVSNAQLDSIPANCSTTLLVGAPVGASGAAAGAITLAGSGTVPPNSPSPINSVSTNMFPCAPADSPASCATDYNSSSSTPIQTLIGSSNAFTMRLLDGLNGDPAAIPVVPGQTVSVTVTLSFR